MFNHTSGKYLCALSPQVSTDIGSSEGLAFPNGLKEGKITSFFKAEIRAGSEHYITQSHENDRLIICAYDKDNWSD